MPTQKYHIRTTNRYNLFSNYPILMCALYTAAGHCCAVIKRAWPCKSFQENQQSDSKLPIPPNSNIDVEFKESMGSNKIWTWFKFLNRTSNFGNLVHSAYVRWPIKHLWCYAYHLQNNIVKYYTSEIFYIKFSLLPSLPLVCLKKAEVVNCKINYANPLYTTDIILFLTGYYLLMIIHPLICIITT